MLPERELPQSEYEKDIQRMGQIEPELTTALLYYLDPQALWGSYRIIGHASRFGLSTGFSTPALFDDIPKIHLRDKGGYMQAKADPEFIQLVNKTFGHHFREVQKFKQNALLEQIANNSYSPLFLQFVNDMDATLNPALNLNGERSPSGSIREYKQGDPSRLIHPKSSARQDELMVKELGTIASQGIESVSPEHDNKDLLIDEIRSLCDHYSSKLMRIMLSEAIEDRKSGDMKDEQEEFLLVPKRLAKKGRNPVELMDGTKFDQIVISGFDATPQDFIQLDKSRLQELEILTSYEYEETDPPELYGNTISMRFFSGNEEFILSIFDKKYDDLKTNWPRPLVNTLYIRDDFGSNVQFGILNIFESIHELLEAGDLETIKGEIKQLKDSNLGSLIDPDLAETQNGYNGKNLLELLYWTFEANGAEYYEQRALRGLIEGNTTEGLFEKKEERSVLPSDCDCPTPSFFKNEIPSQSPILFLRCREDSPIPDFLVQGERIVRGKEIPWNYIEAPGEDSEYELTTIAPISRGYYSAEIPLYVPPNSDLRNVIIVTQASDKKIEINPVCYKIKTNGSQTIAEFDNRLMHQLHPEARDLHIRIGFNWHETSLSKQEISLDPDKVQKERELMEEAGLTVISDNLADAETFTDARNALIAGADYSYNNKTVYTNGTIQYGTFGGLVNKDGRGEWQCDAANELLAYLGSQTIDDEEVTIGVESGIQINLDRKYLLTPNPDGTSDKIIVLTQADRHQKVFTYKDGEFDLYDATPQLKEEVDDTEELPEVDFGEFNAPNIQEKAQFAINMLSEIIAPIPRKLAMELFAQNQHNFLAELPKTLQDLARGEMSAMKGLNDLQTVLDLLNNPISPDKVRSLDFLTGLPVLLRGKFSNTSRGFMFQPDHAFIYRQISELLTIINPNIE